jgi:hypothetical protein
MRKDSLLQSIHEAAAQHGTPSISPISLQSKRKRGFNFVRMVGVGLGAILKGGNQIWSEKRILLYFQIIMS